ncbi:Ig-like domain-containing protein [Pediococcus acidilactici]|uniref:Ig-like domain-containing protein n=7 Tax=Pediococcus acidilactici TaxID=1254 RepID=UPI0013E8B90F|nr:Ig-like domain-containing protein [Pediococcus acidilactici]
MNKNPKNHHGVVDSKVSNFKMYKVNKHWIFASALMLSMLGAGMMQTDTAAHADTVNEPQTEMVHKVAEAKEAQSASITPAKETTTAASSAAPSSAAPAKAAQSSIQNDSAAKVEKGATASSAASSAAPTKAASSAADKSATSAAAQTEQKKADAPSSAAKAEQKNEASASNASKNEQESAKASSATPSSAAKPAADNKDNKAQANNSSAAKPADNSSASDSDASVKKEGVSSDEIGTSGLDTNNQGKDLTNDAAAKAKADVNAQANDKNAVDNKKVDKNKTAKDRSPRAGGSALEDGNLTISGSAVNGLIDNGDGTYSGNLTFNYNGSAWVAQILEGSKIALQIPPQLRDLFAKINASGNWSKYFSGSGEFYSHLGLIPISYQDWTYKNSDFSYDGTNLTLKNPLAGIELVTKDTTVTLNFDIGQAVTDFDEKIDNAGDNYTFTEALVEDSDIIDWHIIGDYAGVASLNTSHLMPSRDELNPPTVNQPVYDNATTLTGKGEPNAEIIITLPTGGTLSTYANENGDFSIAIPAQPAGSEISVSQKVNGQTSEVVKVPVQKAPEVIDKPSIDAPHAGSKYVTGTGIAGDTIQIYMPGVGGNEDILLGTTTVGLDGKWTAQVSGQYNLIEGETIYAVQIKGNSRSDKAYTKVLEEIHVDAPVINPIEEGDTVITGTGEPGDEVTVYFDDGSGTIIGTVTVQPDGTWTVDASHSRLVNGNIISAVQTKNNVTSDKYTVAVKAHEELNPPVINDIMEGDTVITGTGKPGATVTVTYDDGTPIGQPVKVNDDGTWSVNASHVNLKAGDKIQAVQSDGDVVSDPANQTVKAHEELNPPVINDIMEGDTVITGTGKPGATVTVTYDDGTPIGQPVKVNADGTWSVNASHVNLKAGDKIQAVQSDGDVVSDPANQTVKAREELNPPVINDIMEGDTVITGTGKPGATVTVTYDDGTPIGQPVKVNDDGTWSVNASHVNLKAGDKIQAVQSDGDVVSDPANQTVKAHEELNPPVINDIMEGDTVITGTGKPGATVTVTYDDGTPIGQPVKVNADGTWSVNASHVNLKAGDKIQAVQSDGDVVSDPANQTVKAREELNPPVINDIMEGDTVITGTGKPGATVTVTYDDGTPIGQPVKVNADGTWSVNASHVNLKAGDKIQAVQSDGDVVSDPANQTVKAREELNPPVINDIMEGDTVITGTGKPGATVTVTYDDGTPIGQPVKVNDDGTWSVNASHSNLKAGDKIQAVQSDGDVVSDPANQTVKAREELNPPVINDIMEGDTVITGTGKPGATVTVTYDDGTPIGQPVKVNDDGTWSVNASHVNLKAGDKIQAVQSDGDVVSDPANQTVKAREELNPPVINDVTAGDTVITGTGKPGATVTVTYDDGTPIGQPVKVNADGTWSVNASHSNLKAGDKIQAVQSDGDVVSDPANQTVKAREELNPPVINDVTAGDTVITGTGKPGATVTVTLPNGDPLPSVTVDAEGNWTVDVGDAKLQPGDKVTAVQADGDNVSDPTTQIVQERTAPPELGTVTAGDPTISGKGIPGATVTVTVGDKELPPVTVDEDGNWTVDTSGVTLNPDDEVTATQTVDGNTSDATTTTVQPKKADIPAPGVNPVKPGAKVIKGSGQPGDTITLVKVDANGKTTSIGTVTIDEFGDWSVDVPDDVVLAEGDTVRAVETTPDGGESDPAEVIVTE